MSSQPSGVSIGVGPAPTLVDSHVQGRVAHDVAVAAPVDQVRALRQVDVAEGRVAVVARPRQHQVLAADRGAGTGRRCG
jgi:hypothetical protein